MTLIERLDQPTALQERAHDEEAVTEVLSAWRDQFPSEAAFEPLFDLLRVAIGGHLAGPFVLDRRVVGRRLLSGRPQPGSGSQEEHHHCGTARQQDSTGEGGPSRLHMKSVEMSSKKTTYHALSCDSVALFTRLRGGIEHGYTRTASERRGIGCTSTGESGG